MHRENYGRHDEDWTESLDDYGPEDWEDYMRDGSYDYVPPEEFDSDYEFDACEYENSKCSDAYFEAILAAELRRTRIVHWLLESRYATRSGRTPRRSCYSCSSNHVRYEQGWWYCGDCDVKWRGKDSPRWSHFLVTNRQRGRLTSGRKIYLVDWLLEEGLKPGDLVDGWRVIHFGAGRSQILVFCRVDGKAEDD